MKNWKPNPDDYIYALDLNYFGIIRGQARYNIGYSFRTKALAQAALKDVKAVLKKVRKA